MTSLRGAVAERFGPKHSPWALAAIFIVVFLAYSNHFHNSFHFDDTHTVTDNPWIRDLRNIPRFFTDGTTFSALPSNRSYRPIVSTSLAIDYWLAGGLYPAWFHITVFFWFLVQLAAMYPLFFYTLDRARPAPANYLVALFAVTLYGVHPVMAETVNYVIQRGDIFSTLGVVAGLAVYVVAPQWRRYAFYLIPVVLGVLSKPPAVIFPALLFFWIWLFDSKNAKAAALRTIPSAAVCIAGLIFLSKMNPQTFAAGAGSAYLYRLTQPWILLGYFRKFFIPTGLSADTDRMPFASLINLDACLGLVFVASLAGIAWWCTRRREFRPVAFGLIWFLLASLPTSAFPLAEVENDHRMYFPFVGLALAVCSAGALWLERVRIPARIVAPILGVLVVSLVWGTSERNRVWRTEETLWQDVSVKSPRNGRGLMNYGLTLMSRGDYNAALELFHRALVLNPNYSILEINLGVAYDAMGNAAEAERHFTRAISLSPAEANPLYFYGRYLSGARRVPEAIEQLQAATRRNPDALSAHYLLMELFAGTGNAAALKAETELVRARFPDDATAISWAAKAVGTAPPMTADRYVNLSLSYYRAGNFNDCVDSARKAVQLQPTFAAAWNNMGACYNSLSQWDQAIAAEHEALRIEPDLQLAKNNLKWALDRQRKTIK